MLLGLARWTARQIEKVSLFYRSDGAVVREADFAISHAVATPLAAVDRAAAGLDVAIVEADPGLLPAGPAAAAN